MNTPLSGQMDPAYVKARYDGFFADGAQDYAYDRWQRTPESVYHYEQSLRALTLALGSRRADQALEVGCGDGVWTRVLAPHVGQLTCFDLSIEMLQRAQKKLADLHTPIAFVQGDFVENGLSSGSFQMIQAFRCFEYFSDKGAALDQFFRLLAPGGTLVLATKCPQFDWRGYFAKRSLHQGIVEPRALCEALRAHGFELEEVIPAIVGKGLSYRFGRWFGHRLHAFLLATRRWFPLVVSRYVCESYVYVVRKPA